MMEELIFVPFEKEDRELYKEIFQNPVLMKYIYGKALTNDEVNTKYDIYLAKKKSFLYESYKVYDKDIYIGLASIREYRDGLEIGYIVLEDYWHMGYGHRICHLLVRLLDGRLYAIIDPLNIASKTILMKEGFLTIELKDDFELLERGIYE